MTFTEIQAEILGRLNLSSTTASTRIGSEINTIYKRVTTAIGLQVARRTEVQAAASLGSRYLTFTGIEKIITVIDKSSGSDRILNELSFETLQAQGVGSEPPQSYAIARMNAGSVQIYLDCIPQTTFTLYAAGHATASALSGSQEPSFPESFHDIIVEGVMEQEYRKLEKLALAQTSKTVYEQRLSDLRMWVAKSVMQDIVQGGRTSGSTGSIGGGSGSITNGGQSWTQTGLITFDRDPSAPFAVSASSAKVNNLDADKLDGADWNTTGVLPDGGLGLTDVTTNNVTSAKHGFAPKSPADAAKFLNGAATPAFAAVADSDLATTDITTNNVTSSKHGFAPKSPADAATFLNGAATPAFAAVADSDLAMTDVTTNNVTSTKHGLAPKSPADAAKFLNGAATPAFAYPVATVVTSSVTSNQDNWAPGITGHTLIYWNGSSNITVTGFSNSGVLTGTCLTFCNTGTNIATFAHNSGSSSTGNKLFNSATSAGTPVAATGHVRYVYNGTQWQLISHEQGAWITPTFAAGNYTGGGSQTWTVEAGDVTVQDYRLSGRTLYIRWYLVGTSVGGTPADTLRIGNAAWGSFTPAAKEAIVLHTYSDAGSSWTIGQAIISGSATYVSLYKTGFGGNWSAATNNTTTRATLIAEVT
jgi:hypothetical protein